MITDKIKSWAFGAVAVVMFATALGFFVKWSFDQGKIHRLQAENAEKSERIDDLNDANQQWVSVTAKVDQLRQEVDAYNKDRQVLVEKHYVTERLITQQSSDIQKERRDADLEDGPISDDMRLTLELLRKSWEERNPSAGGSAGGSQGRSEP